MQKSQGVQLNRDKEFVLEILGGLLTNELRYGYRSCPMPSCIRSEGKGCGHSLFRVHIGIPTLRNSAVATVISTCPKSGMKGKSGMQECPREDHKVKKKA